MRLASYVPIRLARAPLFFGKEEGWGLLRPSFKRFLRQDKEVLHNYHYHEAFVASYFDLHVATHQHFPLGSLALLVHITFLSQ